MKLSVQGGTYAVVKLPPESNIPNWVSQSDGFLSITRTEDELSIVCPESYVAEYEHVEPNWKAVKVEGILDFSLTGILAGLTQPLAENQISIFAISTYNTDYLLVKEHTLDKALEVLAQAGYEVLNP
ncbi:ACT domain-containing protein [Brevibacillus dissolubilis]|uniref:ACT domain-containing protein n=1 Tax=Brevibacillus dissolubilis TaxID=1844116 RepID=UPI001116BFBA|nr:ACT domain-containing protein [Brevibacillus dissolubilis]